MWRWAEESVQKHKMLCMVIRLLSIYVRCTARVAFKLLPKYARFIERTLKYCIMFRKGILLCNQRFAGSTPRFEKYFTTAPVRCMTSISTDSVYPLFTTLSTAYPSPHVLEIQLNRPEKMNAMSQTFFEECRTVFSIASTMVAWKTWEKLSLGMLKSMNIPIFAVFNRWQLALNVLIYNSSMQ